MYTSMMVGVTTRSREHMLETTFENIVVEHSGSFKDMELEQQLYSQDVELTAVCETSPFGEHAIFCATEGF